LFPNGNADFLQLLLLLLLLLFLDGTSNAVRVAQTEAMLNDQFLRR